METHYIIRRTKDNRPIAGIFAPITTMEMAERTLRIWQNNCPKDSFHIEISY